MANKKPIIVDSTASTVASQEEQKAFRDEQDQLDAQWEAELAPLHAEVQAAREAQAERWKEVERASRPWWQKIF